jgi:hypothetical protein
MTIKRDQKILFCLRDCYSIAVSDDQSEADLTPQEVDATTVREYQRQGPAHLAAWS